MDQSVEIHQLDNGMALVAEPMAEVASGSYVLLTPSGVAFDPARRTGTAGVLAELLFRGAAAMDNRTLNDRLDSLGLQRGGGVTSLHTRFSGALVGDKLLDALRIYADVVMRPKLEADQFELCRELALQSLDSLEDDPRQKISLLVQEQYLGDPLGRPAPGKREELQALTLDEVKSNWQQRYVPSGSILAAAGKVDIAALKATAEELFEPWSGNGASDPKLGQCRQGYKHFANNGAQIHIGVIYPSVHAGDEDYYRALAAVGVLSGGMGSRLFTEVREKRGLCYAVGAAHQVIGPFGAVRCYLGSSPEQAQEGLDVMLAELGKLGEGISQDELDRVKVGLRASLIMQGESSGARAMRCAGDFYHLGRVRSLAEIEAAIDTLEVDAVVEHVRRYPPEKFTIVTLGPKELDVNA